MFLSRFLEFSISAAGTPAKLFYSSSVQNALWTVNISFCLLLFVLLRKIFSHSLISFSFASN